MSGHGLGVSWRSEEGGFRNAGGLPTGAGAAPRLQGDSRKRKDQAMPAVRGGVLVLGGLRAALFFRRRCTFVRLFHNTPCSPPSPHTPFPCTHGAGGRRATAASATSATLRTVTKSCASCRRGRTCSRAGHHRGEAVDVAVEATVAATTEEWAAACRCASGPRSRGEGVAWATCRTGVGDRCFCLSWGQAGTCRASTAPSGAASCGSQPPGRVASARIGTRGGAGGAGRHPDLVWGD